MAPADPNVLLSTAAQATAALVAIVGGFLVSRLVALSSERGSLVQRLQELEAALRRAKARWEEVHDERFAVSRDWFVDHHIDDFIETKGVVDVDAALADFLPVGSSEEEMRPVAENLAERVSAAFRRVSEAYRDAAYPSGVLKQLQERIPDIAAEDEDIYERVGTALADERRGALLHVSISRLGTRIKMPTSDVVLRRQDARIQSEGDLRAQADALAHERDFVHTELRRFGRPEGVGVGVIVLVFFSVVGIGFPMVLMGLRPVPDSLGWRVTTISTFLLGLVVLLGYIAWLVRLLRPPESEES